MSWGKKWHDLRKEFRPSDHLGRFKTRLVSADTPGRGVQSRLLIIPPFICVFFAVGDDSAMFCKMQFPQINSIVFDWARRVLELVGEGRMALDEWDKSEGRKYRYWILGSKRKGLDFERAGEN